MANLNLSEFGEKLFVSDADHTFIWDTANAISKRVSRNSWLNSGTLTSDAPVTISQTWNGTGSTVFKALVVNATTPGTTSSSSSLLLDLQVGGATKVSVNKDGAIGGYAYNGLNASGGGTMQVASGNATFGYHMARDYCVTWGGAATLNGSIEVSLCRDGAANTLALRNGAAAQTFRIYNTTDTGVTTYERAALGFSSNVFRIQTENLAGITAPRDICLNPGTGNIQIAGNGTNASFSFPVSFGGTNTGKLGYFAGAFEIGSLIAAPLRLVTGNLTRVTISDAGNVGIGTTAPGSTLTVAGTLHFGSNNGALPGGTSYGGHIGSSQDFALRGTSTVSTNYYLQNGSSGNKNAAIRLLGSGSADHGGLDINTFESSPIIFSTNLTEKARFSATGNLGIGTTSPSSKLQVSAGDVEVDTIAKGVILKSPDGTRYRVTVANGGTLSVAAV